MEYNEGESYAYNQGCEAYALGKGLADNLYVRRTIEHFDWEQGFKEAKSSQSNLDVKTLRQGS
jgi:hypothetical protein